VDDHALTVPTEAIVTMAGVSKVFLIRDSKAVEVPIHIDTQGDGWVEVHGRLADGETIVTSGHSQLTNGAAVSVRPRVVAESVTMRPTR
jgi:multidrug efflux pump subunit AcrA (membrane-fusion protein)